MLFAYWRSRKNLLAHWTGLYIFFLRIKTKNKEKLVLFSGMKFAVDSIKKIKTSALGTNSFAVAWPKGGKNTLIWNWCESKVPFRWKWIRIFFRFFYFEKWNTNTSLTPLELNFDWNSNFHFIHIYELWNSTKSTLLKLYTFFGRKWILQSERKSERVKKTLV